MNSMLLTDGYKLDHRRQYPEGTEFIYANWTARSDKHFPIPKNKQLDGYVVFGVQYLCVKYLIEEFKKNFFDRSDKEVVEEYIRFMQRYIGYNNAATIGVQHIKSLHRLGYLPIEIRALPEGTVCPIGVPCLTITNTDKNFFWLVNYLETLMSCILWPMMTSATIAREYKKELKRHCEKTGIPMSDFMIHDFSMRGMHGVESAILSGMGHLSCFSGSESLPAIEELRKYYDPEYKETISTIFATEHSVACSNTDFDGDEPCDFGYIKNMLNLYKDGMFSIVADTYDFWRFVGNYIPKYKDDIMKRNGRVVIRPDSGVPEDIICGDRSEVMDMFEDSKYRFRRRGAYPLLTDIFGCGFTDKGYKVMDSHIGMIYGDAITLERQEKIYKRLEMDGISASNLVLGVGSYTYLGRVSRDSLGFALKTTHCTINGKGKEIYKDPKTVSGMPKKSLKGLINLYEEDGVIVAKDQQEQIDDDSLLKKVFVDGTISRPCNITEIKERINDSL